MIRKDVRVKSGARVWVYEARVASNKLHERDPILIGHTIDNIMVTNPLTLAPHHTLITFRGIVLVAAVTLDNYPDPVVIGAPDVVRLSMSDLHVFGIEHGAIVRGLGNYVGAFRNTFVSTANIEPVS